MFGEQVHCFKYRLTHGLHTVSDLVGNPEKPEPNINRWVDK